MILQRFYISRFSFTIVSIIFWLLIEAQSAYAQTDKSVSIPQLVSGKKGVADTVRLAADTTRQKDLPDVIKSIFHVRSALENDSVTSKPEFSVVPAIGYTLVSRLAIVLSGNAAFRTGPKSRISTIVASASYTQNKQFLMPVLSNIWTRNNEYEFVGDYRFYNYPQNTYGLGSSSNIKNEDPMKFAFARFYETALRHISGNWYAGLGYAVDAYWNISHDGPKNGAISDFENYGTTPHSLASGVNFEVIQDSRDNSINPYKGWFGSVQYRTNPTWMGSTTSWQSVIIDLRKYVPFPASSQNVLAFWSYNWLTLHGRPPYLSLPSSSWDPNSATGRGYIQGRFRGAQMVYLESEYRFKITRNGLVGGVLFANAQSLSAEPGTAMQRVQPAFGPGLRLKLNKKSRTNIAIDYGFGRQGSKGLFIDVGEVF
ncbi:BamA/TamA family outer membrane protein [Mucilaginibacter sp. Bleaf8]|uniref:BamA/TamA family outer membrane protein n=1 Tax=Mucilaginibacter sp. Bleaf8 TaxID=2834430 RepID=UPI001BCB0871|nr:BamA/TamA family outer membrane protein [Mucilaginibacter sp. Bleaf8]MBS7564950.1 BamA/TamA family outer membrane protein [Mucilaginibacter sp. Bleaf8]